MNAVDRFELDSISMWTEVAGCFAPLNSPQDESAVADMTRHFDHCLRTSKTKLAYGGRSAW